MNNDQDIPAHKFDPALAETVTDFELLEAFTPSNFAEELMPELEFEASEQLFEGFDPESHVHNTRAFRRKIRHRVCQSLISDGSQFIYGILVLTGTAGLIALATTIQSVELITTALILCPFVMGYALLSWKRWLRGAPYVYRLLTSLGEDAENLSHWRVPFFRF